MTISNIVQFKIVTTCLLTVFACTAEAQNFIPTSLVINSRFDIGNLTATSDGSLLTADQYIPFGSSDISSWVVGGSGVGYGEFAGDRNAYFGVEAGINELVGNGSISQSISGLNLNLGYYLSGSFAALESDDQGLAFSVTGDQTGTTYTSFTLLDHSFSAGDISFSPTDADINNANGTGSRSTLDFGFNPVAADASYTLTVSPTDPANTANVREVAWLRSVQFTSGPLVAQSVPEPSSVALLGVVGLGLLKRRKRA